MFIIPREGVRVGILKVGGVDSITKRKSDLRLVMCRGLGWGQDATARFEAVVYILGNPPGQALDPF